MDLDNLGAQVLGDLRLKLLAWAQLPILYDAQHGCWLTPTLQRPRGAARQAPAIGSGPTISPVWSFAGTPLLASPQAAPIPSVAHAKRHLVRVVASLIPDDLPSEGCMSAAPPMPVVLDAQHVVLIECRQARRHQVLRLDELQPETPGQRHLPPSGSIIEADQLAHLSIQVTALCTCQPDDADILHGTERPREFRGVDIPQVLCFHAPAPSVLEQVHQPAPRGVVEADQAAQLPIQVKKLSTCQPRDADDFARMGHRSRGLSKAVLPALSVTGFNSVAFCTTRGQPCFGVWP
mmetsp:Transcript_103919/g.323916  ORF Transcript_103919/g.323916 Transcript_103919/m.323916 type:complete len:292 (-) Transcript_103919:30-905(-)